MACGGVAILIWRVAGWGLRQAGTFDFFGPQEDAKKIARNQVVHFPETDGSIQGEVPLAPRVFIPLSSIFLRFLAPFCGWKRFNFL
jgi:hypothetical protein